MSMSAELDHLIRALAPDISIPDTEKGKWSLFRSLVNIRAPKPVSDEFLQVQNKLLQNMICEKGITKITELRPIKENIYLWRGDITTLKVDAIVNAANNKMLGCFIPLHGCIDNAIHTFAGVQLRLECAEMMEEQGVDEPTGTAKITSAYNLPSRVILHTVGPIVEGLVTQKNRVDLANCYRSCLNLAVENKLNSIAFCCISTGEFRFPNTEAAQIATRVVKEFLKAHSIKVIFNVFKETDWSIYHELFD